MPELPEVETARAAIEAAALDRVVAKVDDSDTWVCRPHPPGQIAEALVGRRLVKASRRGKTMWVDTSDDTDEQGPVLGLHLGMSGRILVTGPEGDLTAGGDYAGRAASDADREHTSLWDRFTIFFEDGGSLRLFDKRRLGRVRLDPDLGALGPDAERVRVAEFHQRVGSGTAAVKARLLDQSVLAGVGNLLADQALWQARLDPRRGVDTLSDDELTTLHRELGKAVRSAIRHGGVHTGEVIEHRGPTGHCPRCGAAMQRATVGGRTTWFCPAEQV